MYVYYVLENLRCKCFESFVKVFCKYAVKNIVDEWSKVNLEGVHQG